MAALASELPLLSDAGRFRADNLLSSEDWDAPLYSCLDDGAEPAALFPSLEPCTLFDDSFGLDMDTSPPDPPWDTSPISLFLDLQVKSEPVSPASSHCSDSSSFSSASDPLAMAPSLAETLGVKMEQPPTPPCALGDVLAPPSSTVHISLVPPSDAQATPGRPVPITKPEGGLSRKPPLQPKPLVVTAVPMPPSAPPGQALLLQPLPHGQPPTIAVRAPPVVLSSSELLHLPVSGLLQVKAPGPEGPPGKPPKPEAKTIVPAPGQVGSCAQEIDMKVLKRQQRMIKNRESACQSRRKKKEYLQGLEARLHEALAENERLRRENAVLRRRLDGVLSENTELKFGSGNRKVVCIMVVLLFIAFNFGPISISEQRPGDLEPPGEAVEPGPSRRHLLEVGQEVPVEPTLAPQPDLPPPGLAQAPFRNLTGPLSGMKDLMLRDLDKFFLASDCRQFNRTESLRLADELSGWVRRHQINRRKPLQARETPGRQPSPARPEPSSSRYVPASAPRHPERAALSQLQVYQRPGRGQYDFLDAIDRREDTFYVVSFRRDHLLLPAISHNKTSRPKMSLLMPAMALNESVYRAGRDYEVMMQIDCEVMDTRVIHIKSSTVPPSLRRPQAPAPSDNGTQASSVGTRPPRGAPRSARRPPRPLYLSGYGDG
ncbi:cyclic AMP-dependent transcription factor ATF-6 beta isoform X2 [Alligator mississippiensis]|uniref:cyclic AMP-dependent transcription factor ATF-6 beta isoform X2 n=1 Tax=Alligator mississippiensis TaxID=8496 RepID=UPI002877D842|nr:cyclic AMP-dependent transcription factor ATF-6 beta isoform X2 [Alligator mississippiensis]